MYSFYTWWNCDLESNESCPKSKAGTPFCCCRWCVLAWQPAHRSPAPSSVRHLPHQETSLYTQQVPLPQWWTPHLLTTLDSGPAEPSPVMNQLIRHVLGQGLKAVSIFQTQQTTGKKNEQTGPRKGLDPMPPNSSTSQETDPPSGLTDAMQWPTAWQPGLLGQAWGLQWQCLWAGRGKAGWFPVAEVD